VLLKASFPETTIFVWKHCGYRLVTDPNHAVGGDHSLCNCRTSLLVTEVLGPKTAPHGSAGGVQKPLRRTRPKPFDSGSGKPLGYGFFEDPCKYQVLLGLGRSEVIGYVLSIIRTALVRAGLR
jgi:hypothetical protein